jgi:hypothetical protein
VLGERPLVAETPESLFDDDTTPIEKFYIRNNGQIPEETKNPDAWKYEGAERRVDVVEFIEICKALEADPHKLLKVLIQRAA